MTKYEFRLTVSEALTKTIAAENAAIEIWRKIDRKNEPEARDIRNNIAMARARLTATLNDVEKLEWP